MSIETRKTSKGTAVTIRYRDSDGRQHRETLGLREEGWDKKRARAEEALRTAGQKPSPRFEDVAWKWFGDMEDDWKPRTRRAYTRSIERLEWFHNAPVRQIRPKHVAEWISDQRDEYSAKTINGDVSVLLAIFDYAITHEFVESNPAKNAPRPKIKRKEWRILTPEEIQAVDKEFTDEKARLMFRVLTRTGIRRGELRNLRVRDIDFERNLIRIVDSKTDEGIRSIAIPKSLAEQLKEWIKRDGS